MLTIQNIGGWERARSVVYAPYAFALYASELFNAYLAPVMGSVRDWPKLVLIYFGFIRRAEITLRNGRKAMVDGSSIRAFVTELKGRAGVSPEIDLYYYDEVGARGKEIIDIGAYIADSAVYFVKHHGAKRVIAFEPVDSLYKIAVKNVRALRLQKKIKLVNKAVIGNRNALNQSFSLGLDKSSCMITLKNLIRRYHVRKAILKVDCEGYEYGLLEGLPQNTYDIFDEIAVRYYGGYRNIVKKLESLGYKVKFTKPQYRFANMFRNFTAMGVALATK